MALADAPAPAEAAGGAAERWVSHGIDAASRLRSWSDILATTHLAFDIRPTYRTPQRFQAAVTRRRFGDLTLVDCAAAPFQGHRSRAVIGAHGAAAHEDVLGFQFVCKGIELVREGGRKLALKPGDVVLWDGLQPTEIEIASPFSKRTLLFPRERVLAVCPRLGALETLPSLDGSPSARLLVRFMNAMAAELPRLDAAAGGPAGLELDSAGRGSTAPRSGASMGPRLVPHAVCRSLCPPVDVAARRVGRRATDRRLAPTPVRAVAGACIHVANTKNQSETYTLVSRGYGDKSCCRWCSWRRLIAACRAAWRLLPRAAPPSPPPRRTAGRSPRLRLSRRADQMCVVPDRDLRHVQLTSRN